jgi:hypothetical protein
MDSTQLMEKVAEIAPEKYDFLVKTAAEVRESPFRDEIVEELGVIMEKAAFDWKALQGRAGTGLAGVGTGVLTTALGGIGLALAGDMYDASRRAIFKTRNYKRMLAANPDLKEKPAQQVQSIFSTLHRINPEFSGDPVIAGSFVRNHVDIASEGAGSIGLDSLKSLVDARKGLNESRRLPKTDMMKLPDREMEGLQKQKMRNDLSAPPGRR